VDFAVDRFGSTDILVNNPAKSYMVNLLELREDGWDKVFNVNVKGYFLTTKKVAQVMIDKGNGGRIINISSIASRNPTPLLGLYAITKASVNMMTSVFAKELGAYNITVNAIAPGLVRTEFSKPLWSNPDLVAQQEKRIPLGRIAEPEDMTGAALFLASDSAQYITGQILFADGGRSI